MGECESLNQSPARAFDAESVVGRIEWYVECLRQFIAGRPVRGLAEARAGFESALEEIQAVARG